MSELAVVDNTDKATAMEEAWFSIEGQNMVAEWRDSPNQFWEDMHGSWTPNAKLAKHFRETQHGPQNTFWDNGQPIILGAK